MKQILISTIAALGLSLTAATAAEYTVFKVCEDQRILKTSDGADAGHVDYIVVDPASHTVVSTVITGGVLAERHVAIPISDLSFGPDRTVTIREITREKIVSAPVIETTRWRESYVVEPSIIERSYTHFGADFNSISRTSSRTTVDGGVDRTSTRTTVDGGPDRVGTRATVGDRTTDRTTVNGRATTDTQTRTTTDAPDRNRATTDAPDRTRTGTDARTTTDRAPARKGAAANPANRTNARGKKGADANATTDAANAKRSGGNDAPASSDATNKDANTK